MTATYPTRPDAMDPAWLARALGQPADSLSGFSSRPVGTGQMCDSFRLTLDWCDGADVTRPATIIAKCPSLDPASRAIAGQLGSYRLEVGWYSRLAERVSVARPHCHFAAIGDDGVEFLLVLADLAPATQGDQLAGADAVSIAAAVDEAVALHAALWDSPELDRIDWLQRDTRPMVRAMFPTLYAGFRDRYAGRLSAEVLDLGRSIVDRLDHYLERRPAARTLTHGDFRIDNLLFTPDGAQCWVVDWQTLGIGSGATDIAYLVGTSVADAATRRLTDAAMFERWTAGLGERGLTVDHNALWDDYRIGALSGYFMAVFASMSVERTERGDAMFAVMAERPARQAIDLDSLALL